LPGGAVAAGDPSSRRRLLHRLLPEDAETAGLLALMLLHHSGLAAEASAAWARAERAMGNAALQRELHRRRAAAAGSE
jgi:hypothetical protein